MTSLSTRWTGICGCCCSKLGDQRRKFIDVVIMLLSYDVDITNSSIQIEQWGVRAKTKLV